MSHIKNIVLASIVEANNYANFFDSISAIYDLTSPEIQAELNSVKNSVGFCCCPQWIGFNAEIYDNSKTLPVSSRQMWKVSDTCINELNTKQPMPDGASTLWFSPVKKYPDRVEYAFANLIDINKGQSLDDLTDEDFAILEGLGDNYYIQMPSGIWDAYSQETKDFIYLNLGTPVEIV